MTTTYLNCTYMIKQYFIPRKVVKSPFFIRFRLKSRRLRPTCIIHATFKSKTALGIITILLSAPVFAPIFEELFFRGTLYRNVRNHGTWSMMIVCGLTFGIWHGNYPQFLFASAMGFFSCFLYTKHFPRIFQPVPLLY